MLYCKKSPSLFHCGMITKIAQRWHSDARKSIHCNSNNCKENPKIYFPTDLLYTNNKVNSGSNISYIHHMELYHYMELISIWNKIVQ